MHATVLLAVAGAGALGAVSRYVAVLAVRHWCGPDPLPIAVVNVLGCFGFGVCWALAHGRWSHPVATAVLAGFFGAFTTFSAFALDGHLLLVERRVLAFALNVVGQNALGLGALWLGIVAAGGRG